ncbi:SIMPL domain-containing protein [Patescibacteria group bacterium]|nr:SIMPL domain-containing protein [Patescibacteria group bacterium]
MEEKTASYHYHPGKRIVMVIFVIMLLCLSLFLLMQSRNIMKAYDYIGKPAEIQNTISISGEGKVTAIPDVGKIEIGVRTEKTTVAESQKENSLKMNDILKAIKAQKVEDKDIKTSYYYVDPKYDWSDGRSNIVGYTVSQAVSVKIRETDKVSEILKLATENGANIVGSLSFEIDDMVQLKEEARAKAIEDAQVKAEKLAKSLNVKLGRVISFYESEAPQQYDYAKTAYGLGGGAAESVAPAIEKGENEINIQVSISYEIL